MVQYYQSIIKDGDFMRPHKELRKLMLDHDMDLTALGSVIGLGDKTSVSHRMTYRTDWKLKEIYSIMDYFHLPYEQMAVYFPKSPS